MLSGALLRAAERSIAAALARDPVTARRIDALAGKRILVLGASNALFDHARGFIHEQYLQAGNNVAR